MPIGMQVEHKAHQPFRVLFMGRFVGFKNLYALIEAISTISGVALTLVGDGPLLSSLKSHALLLRAPVTFRPPVHGEEKKKVFAEHDLLILPSLTEISPNVALEAHALCLPVLLSEETGLSPTEFIYVRPLKTPAEIQNAILERIQNYESPRYEVAVRDYNRVALEWLSLLQSL
jgi:glycosyltransferase involved in cell wall biosynthesis